MNRRDLFVKSAAVTAGALLAARSALEAAPAPSPFGICIYSYGATRKFRDTIEFLDHCHALGAAGIQMPLTSLDPAFAEQVRAKAADYGMWYEGIVTLPKGDAAQFEQQLTAAKLAGATVVRSACLGSRRYETFSDLAAWQQFVKDSHASLQLAVPILEKHKIALALENHKDWTIEEMVAILHQYGSDYLGSCLDFGNNIALLDAPDAVLKLAPYALSTHAKDIAVEPADQGFGMAEVPMGKGVVDTRRIVEAVRAAHPQARFNYEMITRDPLLIPCLTDKYWATFPERNGLYLARALTLAREHEPSAPLTRVSQQAPDAQAQLAENNLKQCLNYAREHFAS